MSLTGITFANQKITPSDDGRLYGAVLADGILTGCGITFAAATLSVAEGSLLIGTRELRTSGETLSVTGATSGYARVIIDIDLTRAATKTSFEQAQFKIQYAASVSAFPALIQQEINGSGTHYQADFCVVSLGTAGITGIESRLHSAVVPVSSGGTGATTAAEARAKLGITPANIGALPLSGGTVNGPLKNVADVQAQFLAQRGGPVCFRAQNSETGAYVDLFASQTAAGVTVNGDWLIYRNGENVVIDGSDFRSIYIGTSDTPPSSWKPGDLYLKYE